MKICIFTETYYPVVGGGETQTQVLAEQLTARGHPVIVLTRRSDAALQKYERFGQVNVYRLTPTGAGQVKKWGLLISGFASLIRLGKQYDLIFVSGYRIIGLAAVLAGKLLGKPVVLKADSQGEMSGEYFKSGLKRIGLSHTSPLFRLFLGIRNFILKKADAFSAISPEIASEWTLREVPRNKVHLIPNSVETTRFFPVDPARKSDLREKLNLPRESVIVIYTGRLVSYKGLPLLLKVWKEICCRHKNVLLLLAGTGGLDIHNCEQELREYVNHSGLEEHVLFTGVVRNVPEYLQASDLFAFPTENEAFGASLVEAMACGLPVVTTPVGAIKTIVSDRVNGLLMNPGDFSQLFEALDSLIGDPALALQLGQAARRSVQDLYSAETVTQQYLALFASVLPTQ